MKHYVRFLLCLALILALGVYSPVRAENPVLKVVLYEEPPYQFVPDQGSPSGLLVEFFDAIAQKCGYSAEYRVMPSLAKCVQAINQGDADVILGMPSFNQYNLFETVEIYSSSMVLLGPAKPSQNHPGGDTKFSLGYDYNTIPSTMLPRLMSSYHVISSKQNTLLNYLQNKQADAVIVDRLIAGWYYKDWEGEKPDNLNDYLETVKYSIALSPERRILLRELNTGILEFRLSGDYSSILSRWSISEPSQKLVLLLRQVSLILFICTAGAMFYILISNRIRNMLKQEVQEKTLALQCANQSLANQLEQLQFQDELRREIINNSANGLVLVDKNYHVQMINQRAATLANVSSSQEGLMLAQLPRFWALANRIGPDLFSSLIKQNSLSFEYKAPSGETETLLGSVHYIYHNKEVTGALLSMEDITFELEAAKKASSGKKIMF